MTSTSLLLRQGASTATEIGGSWTPAWIGGWLPGRRGHAVSTDDMAGRTKDVSGSMVIDGSTATRASFTLNVASVATSEDERSVMDVTKYPSVTFLLTVRSRLAPPQRSLENPISLGRRNVYRARSHQDGHGATLRRVFRQLDLRVRRYSDHIRRLEHLNCRRPSVWRNQEPLDPRSALHLTRVS